MPEWVFVGARLTVLGMGLVFVLLALLWVLIALFLRFDRPPAPKTASAARRAPAERALDPEILAAVMIAVRAHIRVRRKQAAPAMRAHAPGSLPSRWIAVGRTRQTRNWPTGNTRG